MNRSRTDRKTRKENTMTTKEMLTSVINGTINDEVKAKAREMLASAEKKNGKRAEQSAENRSANLAIAEVIKSKMKKNVTYAASEIVTLIAAEYPTLRPPRLPLLWLSVSKRVCSQRSMITRSAVRAERSTATQQS